MTDVVVVWHMHQPRVVHPTTGRPALPWVRLHAASGYLDMARALERRPGARVTVNFVPALIDQLEALAAGTKDELELLAERPAADLDPDARRRVIDRCFSVRRERVIEPRPRYRELESKRDAGTLDAADLRDLQCLFLLAWLGFAAREDEPGIEGLEQKGTGFSDADQAFLVRCVRGAGAQVLPRWRALAARGQIELATSPAYHPILPLLVDTDAAARARPGDPRPPRVRRPEDALAQLRLARATHERVFGAAPRGLWPPELALSPEAVAIAADAGFAWALGDDAVLARTQPARDAARAVWRHAGVDLLFRDHELSDRIGTTYPTQPAEQAAADLVAEASLRGGGSGGIVGLFLDGENAWESYPDRGRGFLDGVYARLEEGKVVRGRTVSEAIADHGPPRPLPALATGSWIGGALAIWLGDPLKNRAWTLLGQARDRLAAAEDARGGDDPGVVRARGLLLAAEGSDWFWWFGEPWSSREDPVYDALFRAHLAAAWQALGEEAPLELADPIGPTPRGGAPAAPRALISPVIDGRGSRFYEWHGATVHEAAGGGEGPLTEEGPGAGEARPALQGEGAKPPAIERAHLGFDATTLYLRLDPRPGCARLVQASRLVVRVRAPAAERVVELLPGAPDGGPALVAIGGRVAADRVIELALPLASLGAVPREPLDVSLTLEFAGRAYQRMPRTGALSITVPWEGWDAGHWSA